jgi:hypothetical protein
MLLAMDETTNQVGVIGLYKGGGFALPHANKVCEAAVSNYGLLNKAAQKLEIVVKKNGAPRYWSRLHE